MIEDESLSDREDKIEEIYIAALEKRSETERSAFLDTACGSDSTARARVEALLQANNEAGDFLRIPPAFQDAPTNWLSTESPGMTIGSYKLLELIGEGGFGAVYMAEQEEPIRRRVALKIIKLGMDTKQVISRFEAERQALAMMDHPNIAKVYEAGSTE